MNPNELADWLVDNMRLRVDHYTDVRGEDFADIVLLVDDKIIDYVTIRAPRKR